MEDGSAVITWVLYSCLPEHVRKVVQKYELCIRNIFLSLLSRKNDISTGSCLHYVLFPS